MSSVESKTVRLSEPQLQLWRFSGIGNDFLVHYRHESDAALDSEAARALLHRHYGWGADGLIEFSYGHLGWEMTLWNTDGSRAEMSGNGLRCLGHAMSRFSKEVNSERPEILTVSTEAGYRSFRVLDGDPSTDVTLRSETSMSSGVILESAEVAGVAGTHVSMGNPHFVVVVPSEQRLDFERLELDHLGALISSEIEGGSNVEWITPVDDHTLIMKVWERGVGPTLSCGTGSCASFLVARAMGLVQGEVTVVNPGGKLTVRDDGETLWLGGLTDYLGEIRVTLSQVATMKERL